MRYIKMLSKGFPRHWQDSNLRGITPIDFQSIALTLGHSVILFVFHHHTYIHIHACYLLSQTKPKKHHIIHHLDCTLIFITFHFKLPNEYQDKYSTIMVHVSNYGLTSGSKMNTKLHTILIDWLPDCLLGWLHWCLFG